MNYRQAGCIAVYKDFNYTNISLATNVTDYNRTLLNYVGVHQVTPDVHEYNRIH